MKSKLIYFTLIFLFIIPMSFVSGQHHEKQRFGANRILKMARLYSASIRSAQPINSYIVATQSPDAAYISVDFGFEGQFEITISNSQTEFYNNIISIDLSSNHRREQLNISTSDLNNGDYMLIISDLSSKESASGRFVIM